MEKFRNEESISKYKKNHSWNNGSHCYSLWYIAVNKIGGSVERYEKRGIQTLGKQ